jgi:protein-S-isoprenylcysteine O-methyltransferase Ste14
MAKDRDLQSEVTRRFLVRTVLYLVVIGAVLFGAAGTFAWPQAWIYLALNAALSFGGGLWLTRHDPGLLAERLGSLIQRDQKPWDKIFMTIMMALWFGWLVLIALDAKRYHWSEVPLALQVAGFVLLCLGSYLVGLTFRENSYAAPVVKIQKERGHRVVTTGPYAYVRHPMYAGALPILVGAPLLLGSWWGLGGAVGLVLLIALRAVLEERMLTAELDGYADYAARVRYRLVPHLW